MSETNPTSVTSSILVEIPAERAFTTFTEDIGSWWPPEHHLLQSDLAEMVFEPRRGGRVYDRGVDGSECQWATVLAFEPPHRVVFSWNVNLAWRIEEDPAKVSEVEVTFVPDGPERTRVTLEHRHIDRHGEGWEEMRAAVGSPEGWEMGLGRFVRRTEQLQSPSSP